MTEGRKDRMTETLNAPLPFYGGGIKNKDDLKNDLMDKIPPAATNLNFPSYGPEIILPNCALLPNRTRASTDRQTDGQGDSSIPRGPLLLLGGGGGRGITRCAC